MNYKYYIFISGLLVLALSGKAQTNVTVAEKDQVTINLQETMSIEIENSNSDVNFLFANKEDMENGVERTNATIISVNSSDNWLVKFDSDNKSYFIPQNNKGNMNRLSVESLKLRTGFVGSGMTKGLNDYAPLSSGLTGTSNNIASGKRGGGQRFGIDYKANLGPDIPEDIYKVDVRYTISKY